MTADQRAAEWVGYLEHQDGHLLGIYTANVGKGGYTIFAQMLCERYSARLWGLPWCAVFVHAIIDQPDLLGRPHAGTRVLQRRMKRRRFWRGRNYRPQPGDLIFCSNARSNRVDHVGIVESLDGETVSSIEGNTVDPTGVFAPEQGGAVARRIRRLDDPIIVGYAAIGKEWDHGRRTL